MMIRLADKTTTNAAAARASDTEFHILPLANITQSPTNPRRAFDDATLESLAASIRRHGVLQPVLVRATRTGKSTAAAARYELIAGERRVRAARLAQLKEIPARVIEVQATAALELQIIENLQREDVHPLDEAEGFRRLKDEAQLDIAAIAARVARPVSFVARRLSLVDLIDEAQDDLRRERITLAHALEIARLAGEVQPDALAACYEQDSNYDDATGEWRRTPDKESPARHVAHLKEWIADHIHLNLKKAVFALDDTRLRPDGLTCLACPNRSGFNTGLFDDVTNTDTCLNPRCFQAKREALITLTRAELDVRRADGTRAPLISPYYSTRCRRRRSSNDTGDDDGTKPLTVQQYRVIERRKDRCPSAERALYTEGDEAGKLAWICRDATCKDHLARYENASSVNRRPAGSAPTTGDGQARDLQAERNRRKQELFDMKVAERVRRLALSEVVKTYSTPLERAQLERLAVEFFRRVPRDDQRVIVEISGWSETDAPAYGRTYFNEADSRERITKLDDTQLAQFMMLCATAHLGANHYQSSWRSQDEVTQLSDERGVDYRLIDAEVRLELAAKKYKVRHRQYLEAVKGGGAGGEEATKPTVYEASPPLPPVTTATATTIKQKRAGGRHRRQSCKRYAVWKL